MIKAVIFDCFGVVLGVVSNHRNPEVINYVKSLRPRYKTAMLSNVPSRASLERHFPVEELEEMFDVVVASGDVGYEKPMPAIYELTAEKLGVKPEECLFVDDIGRFCIAAESVGMQTVTFLDPEISLEELRKLTEVSA